MIKPNPIPLTLEAMTHRRQLADLMAIRLMATAQLQFQMATALIGKGQDELRRHFAGGAEMMIEAAEMLKSLTASPSIEEREGE
jgi:hypothetical protein